jgi:hypothetical protein
MLVVGAHVKMKQARGGEAQGRCLSFNIAVPGRMSIRPLQPLGNEAGFWGCNDALGAEWVQVACGSSSLLELP